MRETNKPTVKDAAVDCRVHGTLDEKTGRADVPWLGDVECSTCMRVFLCTETADKRQYLAAPDDGFCTCGSWLLPRMAADGPTAPPVFSARPICKKCGELRVPPPLPKPLVVAKPRLRTLVLLAVAVLVPLIFALVYLLTHR